MKRIWVSIHLDVRGFTAAKKCERLFVTFTELCASAGVFEVDTRHYKSSFPNRAKRTFEVVQDKQLILSRWLHQAPVMQISHDKFTSKDWNPAPPRAP